MSLDCDNLFGKSKLKIRLMMYCLSERIVCGVLDTNGFIRWNYTGVSEYDAFLNKKKKVQESNSSFFKETLLVFYFEDSDHVHMPCILPSENPSWRKSFMRIFSVDEIQRSNKVFTIISFKFS